RADKIKRDAVVVLSFAAFARFVLGPLLAQNVDGALNFSVADLDIGTGNFKAGQIRNLNLWIDLECGGKGQEAFLNPFDLGLERGRTSNAQLGLANGFVQ